ncbi:hypothetical protein OIDMADRAFT_173217 [Oidiodendron maius Zn]|uniref:Ketoreductase (KR) domain-containing protein n=1 Tax=Oidiodendron maius (strain Zn) TaxID=913774 RepID=A0A0C3CUP6_OIDMZ|nr:hypothetical protein OIDMADRAFT_173217 [Oidiodendron maius Zn]
MLRGKFFPPKQITTSFEGKIVIVTGSNTGVGYAAALKYVELRASTVILGVRSMEKGETAKAKMEKATGRKGVVEVWELDMASSKSIDAFAHRADTLSKVDAVVLNAGVVPKTFRQSEEGWEMNIQVNTLGTALLAILLIPKLRASGTTDSPSHLTVVSSTGHLDIRMKLEDKSRLLYKYNTDLGVGSYQQHVMSKLFMMWVTRELASRCVDANGLSIVIINDCCPGACRSDVTREFSGPVTSIAKTVVGYALWRPAENGARVLVGATTLGNVSHGRFWSANGSFETGPGPYITSDEGKALQRDVWSQITEVLKEKNSRVKGILSDLS